MPFSYDDIKKEFAKKRKAKELAQKELEEVENKKRKTDDGGVNVQVLMDHLSKEHKKQMDEVVAKVNSKFS